MKRVTVPVLLATAALTGCGGDSTSPAAPSGGRAVQPDFRAAGERAITAAVKDDSAGKYLGTRARCTQGESGRSNMVCRITYFDPADPGTTAEIEYPKVRCTAEDSCFVDSRVATINGRLAFPDL